MDPGTRYGGKKHEFCTAAFGDIFLLTLDSRLFHRIRRGGGIDIALGHPGFATDYILEISLSSQFSLRRNKPSQVWIRDLVKGGPQVLRLKVAYIAKQSCVSKASNLWLGSRAHLRALEAFGFLMLKYAFSHILQTHFL